MPERLSGPALLAAVRERCKIGSASPLCLYNAYERASVSCVLRLVVMCQEWREIVGGPEENGTPGDVLERSESALRDWLEAK